MMGIVKALVGAVVLIFAIAFTYYNLQPGEVKFYNYSLKLPMFIIIFLSVGIGFAIPTVYYSLREKSIRRKEERVYEFLNLFWRDYLGKAFGILRKFLTVEEFIPFYIRTKKEFDESLDIQLDLYNKGIAETSLAEIKFRNSLEDAKILLENALGKNHRNQKARKLLRSVYMGFEEYDKAEELQREILKEIEKERRPKEEKALASILAEKFLKTQDKTLLGELWKLPITPISGAVLSTEGAPEIFDAANNIGILSEIVKVMEERNLLNPEIFNLIEKYKENISDDVLYYVYRKFNMEDKLSSVEPKNPELKLVSDKDKELLNIVRIWECSECGKEYINYNSVCVNCLSVNTFKIKGGES